MGDLPWWCHLGFAIGVIPNLIWDHVGFEKIPDEVRNDASGKMENKCFLNDMKFG
jgi:hypothetical protein